MRLAGFLLLAFAALAGAATAASAATRYAAPGASGVPPCLSAASPCGLKQAVEVAEAGDDVQLAPGVYEPSPPPIGTVIEVPDGVAIHGQSRTERSLIRTVGRSTMRLVGNASAADLDIVRTGAGEGGGGINVGDGTAERVAAYTTVGYACYLVEGTVRSSVCSSTDTGYGGLFMFGVGTNNALVKGSTIVGANWGVRLLAQLFGDAELLTMVNSIIDGAEADIQLSANDSGASATLQTRNSNYEPSSLSEISTGSTSVIDLGGNQSAPPLFVSAATGDFRELVGSPTIDAGLPGAAEGEPFDVQGAPRVAGTAPDIGAHEYVPPTAPALPLPPRPAPSPTRRATCRGKPATIVGTEKRERLVGTSHRDVIAAGGGGDRIVSKGGNDLICAGGGADQVVAGGGRDAVYGEGGHDLIRGGGGNDALRGGGGNDRVAGEKGRDRIWGNGGADILKGLAGADKLVGGFGGDVLKGGAGNHDVLLGGPGRDGLYGNGGRHDVCRGGKGRDRRVTHGCERRVGIP